MADTNATDCVMQIRAHTPGSLAFYMGAYVFPAIFVMGMAGNLLNFVVLSKMKTKGVCFLLAMVVADLCFFVVMLLLNLSVYDTLWFRSGFISYYYNTKMTLLTLANWFSSASIWFVIMVTVERLIAIRTPLRARLFWNRRRFVVVISTISVSTLILQLPYFLWYRPTTVPNCLNRNISTYVLMQIRQNSVYYEPLKYLNVICPIIVVTIPLILLITLNATLIYHVRLSRCHVKRCGGLLNYGAALENEVKITTTILIIVATFFLFNFPSAVIWFLCVFEKDPAILQKLIAPSLLANYMVTFGKALNFPLYCCSSSNFRFHFRRLCSKLTNSSTWRKLSNDTTSIISSLRSKKHSRQYSLETNELCKSKRSSLKSPIPF